MFGFPAGTLPSTKELMKLQFIINISVDDRTILTRNDESKLASRMKKLLVQEKVMQLNDNVEVRLVND